MLRMMTPCTLVSSLMLGGALLLSACAAPDREPPETRSELPPILATGYAGPTPSIEIRPSGEQPAMARTVVITLTVPSGGHRINLDRGEVIDGEAFVFLTIEEPAEDEIVTMALETLRTEFQSSRTFDVAKVYIRTHRRGEAPPAAYRFAGDERMNN